MCEKERGNILCLLCSAKREERERREKRWGCNCCTTVVQSRKMEVYPRYVVVLMHSIALSLKLSDAKLSFRVDSLAWFRLKL